MKSLLASGREEAPSRAALDALLPYASFQTERRLRADSAPRHDVFSVPASPSTWVRHLDPPGS